MLWCSDPQLPLPRSLLSPCTSWHGSRFGSWSASFLRWPAQISRSFRTCAGPAPWHALPGKSTGAQRADTMDLTQVTEKQKKSRFHILRRVTQIDIIREKETQGLICLASEVNCYLCEEAIRGFAVFFQNLWRRRVAVLKLRVIPKVWLEELGLLTFYVGWFNGGEDAQLLRGILSVSTAFSQLRESDSRLKRSVRLATRTRRQAHRTAQDGYIVSWPGTMEKLWLADFVIGQISWCDQHKRPHISMGWCGDDALCSFKLSVGRVLEPLPFIFLLILRKDQAARQLVH